MKKLKTVTIVISAYNEEKTVLKLLNSINVQNRGNFLLEKVLILCDGCTDKTAEICREFSRRNKGYSIQEFRERKGKAMRLMKIFEKLTTDIVIIFDADVVLGNNFVIEELVNGFSKDNIGIVGGFNMPMAPRNYFESLIITWLKIWNGIRFEFNSGNTVHNSLGCVLAINKNVASKVKFPSTIIPDDDFIYFTAITNGYKFKFSKKSIVHYRTIDNFSDFLKQHSRLYHSKEQIFDFFGDWTKCSYDIPTQIKTKYALSSLASSPIKTVLAIALQSLVRIDFGFKGEIYTEGFWSIAKSSKL